MIARRITPPAALAVALAQAITGARADGAGLDADVAQAVRGITENAEHATRRAFVTQTWRATLNEFPAAIQLPMAPLQSVVHVKFYDVAGQQQTLDPQDYIVDTASEPGLVVPAPGKSWPATAARLNAVEVQYVCGYGDDDTAVPDAIKSFILARVAELFTPSSKPSPYLAGLLDRYTVYS